MERRPDLLLDRGARGLDIQPHKPHCTQGTPEPRCLSWWSAFYPRGCPGRVRHLFLAPTVMLPWRRAGLSPLSRTCCVDDPSV